MRQDSRITGPIPPPHVLRSHKGDPCTLRIDLHIDHDVDHSVPQLLLSGAVRDLPIKYPTQETCARSCRFFGSHPALSVPTRQRELDLTGSGLDLT